ncbi:MAG: HEAT repeat domain-containing protein [Thermoleophilia bacterium]|nr:HEAT repeat domain-containing protein [Thermoleophilia bacterium]
METSGRGVYGGAMEILDALIAALKERDGMRRKRARETLILAGDPAVGPLLELTASSDKQTRWEATKALAAMVEPACLDSFVKLMSDSHSDIRWLAADGLIALGPRSVVPVLKSLLNKDLPRGHLDMSHRVLRELAEDNSVLAAVVEPVLLALRSSDVTALPSRAEKALLELDHLTGRLMKVSE